MPVLNDDIDYLKFLAKQESQYIEKASAFTDKVLAELRGANGATGDTLPWEKTHQGILLRPGEVSIWGAYNGHGKSQILGQICAWGLINKKWLIASMEMPPRKTLLRMVRQVAGKNQPDAEYIKLFLNWTDDRLWIYDQTDTVKHERILGMVHYASKELGIQHIVIDSLMKCGFRGSKDIISGQQVDFVDRLCWAAKTYNNHIHIVHHMRKGEGNTGEYKVPGKHDFRGAGELVDLVDNAFIIHRNKAKEESKEKDQSKFDATLKIVKQRHGEFEGTYGFFFHPASLQYLPKNDNVPAKYISETFMESDIERRAITSAM